MQIDGFDIDVQKKADKRHLKVQSAVMGVRVSMTRPELEALALLLAHRVGEWADEERQKAEAAQPKAEPSAPVMINPQESAHGN